MAQGLNVVYPYFLAFSSGHSRPKDFKDGKEVAEGRKRSSKEGLASGGVRWGLSQLREEGRKVGSLLIVQAT